MKFGLWLISACAFCVVQAADYSRVAADVSALSAEKGFVGEMLKKRIEMRTAPSDAANTLAVRFALDDAIKGENAVVTVKNGTATIRAGRFRGLVFGAGVLLRTARYVEKSFSLADGEYRFEPKKSLRMCYMARHFLNWYHLATPDELTAYIDDLALSGHNAFKVQCELPTSGKNGNFEKASLAVVNRVHALDCGFCSGGGNNQAPEDSPEELRGVPNSDPRRGNLGFNVCISKPGGMDYLCRLRKGQIEKLAGSNSDYFCYWPFDEGGCECDGCKPWGGNGFLRLIERFRAMNNAAFPNAKTIISTWVFHDDDWEGLYKWLETHDGVDYILADSHTDFPKYPLEHPTPKGIPIMTFPEISMWGRAPWGGYGATALPKRFTRLFRQVERIADGFMSYSEGLYEDINKEVVNALYINPSADTGDILRAYAAYHLPGTAPEDFVKLCDIFETNHKFPGDHSHPSFKGVAPDSPELAEYRSRAAEACRIVERMEKAILPSFRNDWRWRLVYLRAMIDREILATRQRAPESARKYFEELVKMYHAERQLAGWRKTGKRGWTTPQFKSREVRPVTPEALETLKHSLIHRGDGKGRPDNTMEALLYTWAKGYTPESDIRYTKDGKIVAFHDNSLKKKKISEWLWADLREEDVGSYRGAQYATCRAPLWETIFTAMEENPARKIHIDWKDVPPEKVAEMVKAHGLERQCWFITREYDLIKRYKAALPNGQTLHWMNLGNWGRIDFSKPEELEKCEANMMALFEKAAAEGFKNIDNVQLHCQLRYDAEGKPTFCPKPETMKKCVERLHAAGVEASMCVWQEEANRPETYLTLWEMGFDSFGTDYPEALYKAVEILRTRGK